MLKPAAAAPRLLLVVPSFYPDVYGGAERQASILAEALERWGVRVCLLAPTLRGDTPRQADAAFGVVHRIRLKALPARGGRYLGSTLAWTLQAARFISRRRAEFDLIYVFHGRLHVAGPLLGAKAAGLPVFVKLGAGGESFDFRALLRKRFLYGRLVASMERRWTTGFVAVSQQIEQDLLAFGVEPMRIHRLPNGVEVIGPSRMRAARAARTGRRFISTCRLVHDKNVDVLIEALASLPQAELTLVGDGPEQGRLQAQAARLGLADRVRFVGALEEVGEELLVHDAFVTASVREGQSNSLLEALAAGVIPVAADASGVREVIEDGRNGLIAATPTAEAFAQAMGRVLALTDAERLAMSEAARTKAAAHFGVDGVAERLLGILQGAVTGRR